MMRITSTASAVVSSPLFGRSSAHARAMSTSYQRVCLEYGTPKVSLIQNSKTRRYVNDIPVEAISAATFSTSSSSSTTRSQNNTKEGLGSRGVAALATLFAGGVGAMTLTESSINGGVITHQSVDDNSDVSQHARTQEEMKIQSLERKGTMRIIDAVSAGKGSSTEIGNVSSSTVSSIHEFQEKPEKIEGPDNQRSSEVSLDELPVFKSTDVAKNNGQNGRPVWITYGGTVYDITEFIPNHPGGSEKIMQAAGGAVEPHWHLYRQHFASTLPMQLLEKMIVGRLADEDQEKIDEAMEKMTTEDNDPYAKEPIRHSALKVHSEQPMNAETPTEVITESYLTPPELFYIRHHHPVPYLTDEDVKNYRVKIDLSVFGGSEPIELSLEDLQKLPKVEITSTLQCSGNRRKEFNTVKKTSGTKWEQGAISTARWGGVRLRDVLSHVGMNDFVKAEEEHGLEHVQFESLDGMKSSIGIRKATARHGDCILAYEMNGQPLPRDHGYPLRLIVPGYAAVRNVKWISKIKLSTEEAEGPWQRGLNYKMLPPGVTDVKNIDLDKMPPMMVGGVFSGITKMQQLTQESGKTEHKTGDRGWAWSGGGRNIVRVDVSGDNGDTWTAAELLEGNDQKFGKAWAWVFWTADVPAIVREDGTLEVCSKSVDHAFNVQTEKCKDIWNVRGLGNSSWFRYSKKVQ